MPKEGKMPKEDKMSKVWERQGREHQTVASMMMTNRDKDDDQTLSRWWRCSKGCNEEMSTNIAVKISNRKPWSRALIPLKGQIYLGDKLIPLRGQVYCGQTYHSLKESQWQHPRRGEAITWIHLPPQPRKTDQRQLLVAADHLWGH